MLSRLSRFALVVSLVLVLVGGVYCEVVEGCYGPPEPCLERTLSCGDGNVIIMTSDSEGGSIRFGTKSNNCTRLQEDQCNSTCCKFDESENDMQTPWTGRGLLSVYQRCINQHSCNLTPFYQPNTTYQSVYYSYSCIKENAVHNLLNPTAQSLTNESFIYYSGEDQPLETSCSCQIINIHIEDTLVVYYRDLSVETCSKIRIYPQDERLLNCSTRNENFQEPVNMTGGSRVQFKDLVFKRDEYFLFKLTVNQGFRNLSCVCTDPPVIKSPVNKKEKDFEYTGLMIGLIVAALMIIVGVVLFCYWRKRIEQTEVVTLHTRKRRSTLMDIYNKEQNRQSTTTTSTTYQDFTADNADSVKDTNARPTSESHDDDDTYLKSSDGLSEVPLRSSNNSRRSGGLHDHDGAHLKPPEVLKEIPLRNSYNSRQSGRSSKDIDEEPDADDYKIPPAPRQLELQSESSVDPVTTRRSAADGDNDDHLSNQDIYVNDEKDIDQNPDEEDNYVVPCEDPGFYIDMDNQSASRPQSRVTPGTGKQMTSPEPPDDFYENVQTDPDDDGALDIYEEMDSAKL